MKLGKLKKVALRKVWQNEARDFTTWLSRDENLELLGDELGIEIINAQTEAGVGKFSVDILAEDSNETPVVIENQLEKTDHDHLGKIITYASGVDAEYVIWIAAKAQQEHQQAINWLNENTGEHANFFLIQVEAWQIGESDPAPKFNIIAKPNEWAKVVKQQASGSKEVSEYKLLQQDFFEKLKERGEDEAQNIRSWQTPRPQHWYSISIGTSKAKLSAKVNQRESYVAAEFYVYEDTDMFRELGSQKESIHEALGFELEWYELANKKASRAIVKHAGDIEYQSQHDELIDWLIEKIDAMGEVFGELVKKY